MTVSTDRERPAHGRPALVAAALVVVGVGLAARGLPGVVGDLAGGVLYAALATLLVALAAPAARPAVVGGTALALCVAVELAQLTGLPARAVDAAPPLRYVLGTTFHAPDLAAYAVGACAASAGLLAARARAVRKAHAAPHRGR